MRFGSDFNGVSDALEGNLVVDSTLFDIQGPPTTNSQWLSMRGNSLTNTAAVDGTRPPIGDGLGGVATSLQQYGEFINGGGGGIPLAYIPVITSASATTLTGTCGLPAGAPYTNLVVDLYAADTSGGQPQGGRWLASFTDNSPADSNPTPGAFTFSTAGLGLTSGMGLTITVTYTSDAQPTITSVSRAGNQTTVTISNPGQPKTALQQSSSVSPASWSTVMSTYGGTNTFTDSSSPQSFYRTMRLVSTPGQTSPFSDVYYIP
jgi:hypothetical protein